jgi:hypothetical protein
MTEGVFFQFLIFNFKNFSCSIYSADEELNEKKLLLEEHERLNTSLSALTRHFAHVQLRLQQVVSAPTPEDREVKKK